MKTNELILELDRMRDNPTYFIEKMMKIDNSTHGKMSLTLNSMQKRELNKINQIHSDDFRMIRISS